MTKVLGVEDEPDFANLLGRLLELRGYVVVVAYDGREGLTKALEEQPDLVITDMMMPVMDGREMIDQLRDNAWARELPVILMSAVDQSRRGYDYFLRKPFGLSELVHMIAQALGTSAP